MDACASRLISKMRNLFKAQNDGKDVDRISNCACASRLISGVRNLWKAQNDGKDVDRISNLPDNMLHHILSFLPTKYAVSTCILSTRWKYLWTSIPYLDFCDRLLRSEWRNEHQIIFINFVERVLLHHDATHVHNFCLSSRSFLDASRVNALISLILRRKIPELILSINMERPLVFPCSLFTCESLRTLKIGVSSIEIPSLVCFSSLKVLCLEYTEISCHQGIQEVFFSFPVLEELLIIECEWEIKIVNISASTLNQLIIIDYSDCVMKLHAKHLKSLDLSGDAKCKLSLCNPSSLVYASIGNSCQTTGRRVGQLLRSISDVKELCLTDSSVMAISRGNHTVNMLTFSNLKHLTVWMNTDWFTGEYLTELLCHLPTLESLLIVYGNELLFEEYDWTPVPRCFLSHLKSVAFGIFYGIEKEISLVGIFLRNVKALEKMTIIFSETLSKDPVRQREVMEQILMLPRGSTHSVIDFLLEDQHAFF